MSVQVISECGKYNKSDFSLFIQQLQIDSEYRSLAIIGSEKIGKSTILNQLFGTTFTTKPYGREIQQTTQGINVESNFNLLIFDVEGTDDGKRGERASVIENGLALFALVASDILIVNMSNHYSFTIDPSGLSLLRTVLKSYAELFEANETIKRKKVLLFIRDFDSDIHDFDEVQIPVLKTVNKIWKDIGEDHPMSSQFEFEVIAFPHYYYRRNEFNDMCDRLLPRFTDPTSFQYFFSSTTNNLPLIDLPNFFGDIWSIIKSDEDLSILNDKLLLSKSRCSIIKEDVLSSFEANLEMNLQQSSDESPPIILNSLEELITAAKDEYEMKTKLYHFEIAQNYKKELDEALKLSRKKIFAIVIEQFYSKLVHFEERVSVLEQQSITEKQARLAAEDIALKTAEKNAELEQKLKELQDRIEVNYESARLEAVKREQEIANAEQYEKTKQERLVDEESSHKTLEREVNQLTKTGDCLPESEITNRKVDMIINMGFSNIPDIIRSLVQNEYNVDQAVDALLNGYHEPY